MPIISPMKPNQALVFYVHKGISQTQTYIEHHEILENDGRFFLGSGSPLSKNVLKSLVKKIYLEDKVKYLHSKGFLPSNLLYQHQSLDNITLIWFLPPARRTLYFTDQTCLPSTEINLPGLILKSENNSSEGRLSVFAFKGKKPKPSSPLYIPPFYNLYDDGRFCTGNVNTKIDSFCIEEIIAHWENFLFNSYFSHPIHNREHLPGLLKFVLGRNDSIDFKDLVSAKRTLNDLIGA